MEGTARRGRATGPCARARASRTGRTPTGGSGGPRPRGSRGRPRTPRPCPVPPPADAAGSAPPRDRHSLPRRPLAQPRRRARVAPWRARPRARDAGRPPRLASLLSGPTTGVQPEPGCPGLLGYRQGARALRDRRARPKGSPPPRVTPRSPGAPPGPRPPPPRPGGVGFLAPLPACSGGPARLRAPHALGPPPPPGPSPAPALRSRGSSTAPGAGRGPLRAPPFASFEGDSLKGLRDGRP